MVSYLYTQYTLIIMTPAVLVLLFEIDLDHFLKKLLIKKKIKKKHF